MTSEIFRDYAKVLGFTDSETMEKILTLLFPDLPSRQVLAALGSPATAEEIALTIGLPEQQVQEVADHLVKTGAIAKFTVPGGKYLRLTAVIELRDAVMLYPGVTDELAQLWDHLISRDTDDVVAALKEKKAPAMLRVVPIEYSVPSENIIVDIDSVRAIIEQSDLITANPCACRLQAAKSGRGKDCPAPKDVNLCIQTNAFAKFLLERGIGEVLSKEEAVRRLKAAETAGLVHQIRNNVKKDMILCSCCSCCCTARTLNERLPFVAKSRFQVEINAELCNGCGKCVKRCIYNAIQVDKKRPIKERKAEIDLDQCYGCGNCTTTCSQTALSLKEVRPREHVRQTSKF